MSGSMIRVLSVQHKGTYEIIAVASHQKDLNNLRLMSYRLNDGKDKVQLNKDKYGGPYIKINCNDFKNSDGNYNLAAIDSRVNELNLLYN